MTCCTLKQQGIYIFIFKLSWKNIKIEFWDVCVALGVRTEPQQREAKSISCCKADLGSHSGHYRGAEAQTQINLRMALMSKQQICSGSPVSRIYYLQAVVWKDIN